MTIRRSLTILSLAVSLSVGAAAPTIGQETPRPKDDALDSLLEKLSEPSDRDAKPDAKDSKKEPSDAKKAGDSGDRPAAKGDPAQGKKADDSSKLSGKDQEVDELLQKLGETVETPAPDDRRRGGGGGEEKTDARGPSKRPEPGERNRLTGKDKETDEHLEELTGRKRRKKNEDNEERSGPAGQIIKEMRDIEQKLAKPDTGESTRQEQKQVVKEIEKLIEEAKKSGSSSMRRMLVMQRRRQQQGRERGQQPGQTEGAMAQGAPASKPARPPSKHSNAGGKDIWGHLPPELRAEIENQMNEQELASMAELIQRYYKAVNEKKLVREETP